MPESLPAAMRGGRLLPILIVMLSASKLSTIALALLTPLGLASGAHARPLTTSPGYVLNIHVTITDTRIALNRHRAPRGVEARFVIENVGTRTHNITLKRGSLPGFSRTLRPSQHKVVQLFLDYRTTIPYFADLPADRSKSGMRGVFVVY